MADIKIDRETCVGCGACVDACPVNIYSLDSENKSVATNTDECVLCRACESACPVSAIEVSE